MPTSPKQPATPQVNSHPAHPDAKDGGRRADGLEVELNNIDYFDVSF
ncbi:hypothetical protein OHU34_02470 [Streptomyces sp. NBC_00080]|nr:MULTISPECIES: hypothetical protein [Streptomyces]